MINEVDFPETISPEFLAVIKACARAADMATIRKMRDEAWMSADSLREEDCVETASPITTGEPK